jgi:hypothetical protein
VSWLASLSVLVVSPLLLAGERFSEPKTAEPNMWVIRAISRDEGVISAVSILPRSVIQKGKPLVMKLSRLEMPLNIKNYTIRTVGGKKVNQQQLWDLLKVGQAFLVALDHNGVDPVFLKLLAPDAIILVPLPLKAVPPDPLPSLPK